MADYEFNALTPEEIDSLLFDELEPDGDIEKVRVCIAADASINKEMPILVAITANRLDMVKLLVESGADVNKVDYDTGYETALFRAKFLNLQNIVEYLEPLTTQELKDLTEQVLKLHQPQPKKSKKKR